jgi:ComF family protein
MSILAQAFRDALGLGWRRLGGALLPGCCLLCAAHSADQLLCPACRSDLPGLPADCCPVCAQPAGTGQVCGACLRSPPHFARCHAAWAYAFPVDRLVQALKYGHRLAVADFCGEALAARIAAADYDLLLPLPLHPARLRERGFNQAGEIARGLAGRLGLPVERTALRRCRPTATQAALPLADRRRNVRGAFECAVDFSGRRLLLVDDVMTSGATADECARVLRLHGAAEIVL